jgi:hypothetical protein
MKLKKKIFNHHIDLRYLFTPFATTRWNINNIPKKFYYIFGFRIASITLKD